MSQPPPNPRKRVENTRQKRIQIDDDNGWTHITTSNKKNRTRTKNSNSKKSGQTSTLNDLLRPAEPPGNLTFQGLQEQFNLHKRRWEDSQCHGAVKRGLERALLRDGRGVRRINRCVCIGLGSLSGFLRGGWVDRRAISLYQLAGLVSILEWISSHPSSLKDSNNITTHAQDPVFNKLDKKLLSSLNIQVVNDPAAFDLVDENTFLYCPGAERSHLVDLLKKDPALFFGGPLEEGGRSGLLNDAEEEAAVLSKFTQTRDSIKLPAFEPDEHAFWNMRLYWRREDE